MVTKVRALRKPAAPRRGRPSIHDEAWSKVSVVLMDRQVARLDRLASDIHASTGTVLTRASVIRALIDAVIESGVNVANISSEPQLRQQVAKRIRPSARR